MGQFTQPESSRTYTRKFLTIHADGSMHVSLEVKNAAGKVLENITIYVPVSGPITDEDQQVLAASVPAGLNTARTSFITAIDNAIDAAATAGRFNR